MSLAFYAALSCMLTSGYQYGSIKDLCGCTTKTASKRRHYRHTAPEQGGLQNLHSSSRAKHHPPIALSRAQGLPYARPQVGTMPLG